MPKMLRSRYEQGLAAYRAGLDLIHLHEIGEEIEKKNREQWEGLGSKAATADPAEREAIDAQREALATGEYGHEAMPSLIAGFADGVIADIRHLAASPSAMRRGQKA